MLYRTAPEEEDKCQFPTRMDGDCEYLGGIAIRSWERAMEQTGHSPFTLDCVRDVIFSSSVLYLGLSGQRSKSAPVRPH